MKQDPIAKAIAIALLTCIIFASIGCDSATGETRKPTLVNNRIVADQTSITLLDSAGDIRATLPRDSTSEIIVTVGASIDGAELQRYADGLLEGFRLVIVERVPVSYVRSAN